MSEARYHVERHDQEDGSISYEVWDYNSATYRRLFTVNDSDNKYAFGDANLIAKVLNDSGAKTS